MAEPTLSAANPLQVTPPSKQRSRWPDAVLLTLVLLFAFAAASFPARNSDVWLHLASGRLLADDEYRFGADPFAYTTTGMYWANHSWLFDLLLYTGYQELGDSALVVLKALGVVLLAVVMLRLSGRNGPFWIGAASVLLALLAMSPRLLLQPACVSILFLAVCLWLLRKGRWAFYALPAMIVLWVNVDGWFLLGPALVGLYWLGQRFETPCADSPRLPRWLLPACLLACLCSPHHIHALTLPPELSPAIWTGEFRHDVRLTALFASSFNFNSLGQAGGYNLAVWAYFILLSLSVISFAVQRTAIASWRFPIWLVFALLAAWQARLVPFFAVLAGPITALNFRERFTELPALNLSRIGVALVNLALLMLTWPGWLQGLNRSDRPLDWSIPPEPSLQRAAENLAERRKLGLLPAEARTFAMHPDVAHYCEWFCPGERVFLDSRLALFEPVAKDYERLCLAICPNLHGNVEVENLPAPRWNELLAPHHIDALLLYDLDPRVRAVSLHQINHATDQWGVLSIDGLVVVAGSKPASLWKKCPAFDPEYAVYAGDDSPHSESYWDAISLVGPRNWWDYYLERPSGSSWEADAANVFLFLFEDYPAGQLRNAAGIVGLPASGTSVHSLVNVSSKLAFRELFESSLKERPAALALLAARSARKGLNRHPDDAGAWLSLAKAYLALSRSTAEGTQAAPFPPLVQIRYVQMTTALVQAITYKPTLTAGHEMLAHLYQEMSYYDLALRHHDIHIQLVRQEGRRQSEDSAAFNERIRKLEFAMDPLRKVVQDNENRFLVRTHALTSDPLARARIALDLNLAGKALDEVLLKSHPDLYRIEGLRLMIELMLMTGRANEAGELLARDEFRQNPDKLGWYDPAGGHEMKRPIDYRFPALNWFQICHAVAVGDYSRAYEILERVRGRMQYVGEKGAKDLQPQVAKTLASEIGLGSLTGINPVRTVMHIESRKLTSWYLQTQFLEVERADLDVLEGMFRLERGEPAAARRNFTQALTVYSKSKEAYLPGRPLAQRYLERINSFAQPKNQQEQP
jgi:hypothetical protein